MMAKKPLRNWGRTYNQLWSIAMVDPIGKQSNQKSTQQRPDNPKDNYCWKWNKGRCKRWNCPFDHKCSYCGSFSHIANNCFKKKNKTNRDGNPRKKSSPGGDPTSRKRDIN